VSQQILGEMCSAEGHHGIACMMIDEKMLGIALEKKQ
jgi:hypothetical protein